MYAILVATVVAYAAWFTGLQRLPAGTVGILGLLNPVTGVVLGVAVAAEPFGPAQLFGVALVIAGVLIGVSRPRPGGRPRRTRAPHTRPLDEARAAHVRATTGWATPPVRW